MSVGGTKLPDGTIIIKGNPQQPNRMTCMGCHNEAHVITRPDGKQLYQCTGCGREWIATKF